MKKRFAGLFLTLPLVFTLTTALAVEGDLIFNIEGFQKYAVENSRQAVLDNLQIKAMESALEDAKEDAEFQSYSGTKIDMLNNAIKKEVAPLEAQANVEYARREKEKNVEGLKLDVYKATLDMLLVEKELETETEKLDISSERYSMFEARHREGKITDNDLSDAQYSFDTKKIDKDKTVKKLETANLELKRLLSLELDNEPLKIEEELVLADWEDVDLEEVIEEALKNNMDIYKKSKDLEAKQKTMEITEKYYKEGNFTYDDNKANLETAKIDFEDAKVSLEVDIRNKYNDLLTKKDKVELASKWLDIQKKKLDNAERKYQKGLISREELLGAKEKFLDAQYENFVAIRDFNIVKAEFEALCK